MAATRSAVVSSFTIIKGALISKTYRAFQSWDFALSKAENLGRLRDSNLDGEATANWARDVAKVLNRRFDPEERDRPLVELAQGRCDLELFRAALLWHMTRDEFLVRDFFVNWLYAQYESGTYRLHTDDLLPYLAGLAKRKEAVCSGKWSPATSSRVASGLLRMAVDLGVLRGNQAKEFTSYHLHDDAFLYLLHAIGDTTANARKILEAPDWRMFLLSAADVEREVLRLHQFHRLHYEVAGSLVRLDLPCASAGEFVRRLVA